MADTPRIVAFAGSARADSYNKRLVRVAASAAERAGATVSLIDLRDFPMPLFDQDAETAQGMPEPARRFKSLLIEHDGFLIAAPEYNSSITPLLKNAIDWASRSAPGEPPLAAFRGKVATLMAASPGALGGLRGLVTVRSILGNIGVIVLPDQVAVPRAHEAFATDGSLVDATRQAAIERLGQGLASFLQKLKA